MTRQSTFIVDCHWCKAKVAANERGRAEQTWLDSESGYPSGLRLLVGSCPMCATLLVGESQQLDFAGYDAEEDRWSDVVRVYPKPPKAFLSYRIPKIVTDSLAEADRCLQSGANIAACAMLGRALEAVCRDLLAPRPKGEQAESGSSLKPSKKMMLGEGIRKLRESGIIDDRLFNWSEELKGFRNLAAHPEDISISREDAADLQSFVYAIVEYVYDLADKYQEFKERSKSKGKKGP